jgi:hypothetical protein
VKRKKTRRRFEGESQIGKWALTIDPEKSGYVVSDGTSRRFFPNFDNWAEDEGLTTIRRQLEIERDYWGTILFKTREHANAVAMKMTAPDNHKTGGHCDCSQCVHYANEARAREALRQSPIEL